MILGQGLTRAFFRVAIGIKTALQIMLVGVDIFRPAFFRRLHLCSNRCLHLRIRGTACELAAQLPHDGLGEFGFDGEDVFQVASKIFRPKLFARIGSGKPGRDAHNVAGLSDTSIDQMSHAQFLPDLLRGGVLAFEGKRRCPRGHVQAGNFLQHSQQLLADSV